MRCAPDCYRYVTTNFIDSEVLFTADKSKKVIVIDEEYRSWKLFNRGDADDMPCLYMCLDGSKFNHIHYKKGCVLEMLGYADLLDIDEHSECIGELLCNHSGIFVGFVKNETEEVNVVYGIPQVDRTIIDDEAMKFMTILEVSLRTTSLFIVAPIQRIMRKFNVLNTGEDEMFVCIQ